ncbi:MULTISPECIES: GH25 family lysozyme [unclassified Empedobacter]|nr:MULTISPECIES: GH25 family lysozyme [unclassified Empedobacter]
MINLDKIFYYNGMHSSRKKYIKLLPFTLILLIGILFYIGILRFNYPSSKKYPIQGIDVSNHQNLIEWEKIDKTKIHFVYIKATEGGDFKDKRFDYNWKNAKKNRFFVGAYHFFTFCKTGEEQANNFIETVPIEQNNLPPVIDLEYGGNCKLVKSKNELISEIKIFENIIHSHYNKKPILYVTEEFYNDYLIGQFEENMIWFRDIYKKPTIKDNRHWDFWQFANRAHIKGINTYVDLNVFNGNQEDFNKLVE